MLLKQVAFADMRRNKGNADPSLWYFLAQLVTCWMCSYLPLGIIQVFAYMSRTGWSIPTRLPYLADLCPQTFLLIDEVLSQICHGMEMKGEWPPPLEKECVAVSTLNLLNLQVSRAFSRSFSLPSFWHQSTPLFNLVCYYIIHLVIPSLIIYPPPFLPNMDYNCNRHYSPFLQYILSNCIACEVAKGE